MILLFGMKRLQCSFCHIIHSRSVQWCARERTNVFASMKCNATATRKHHYCHYYYYLQTIAVMFAPLKRTRSPINDVINICVQFSTNCNLVWILPQSGMNNEHERDMNARKHIRNTCTVRYTYNNNNNSNIHHNNEWMLNDCRERVTMKIRFSMNTWLCRFNRNYKRFTYFSWNCVSMVACTGQFVAALTRKRDFHFRHWISHHRILFFSLIVLRKIFAYLECNVCMGNI